MTIPEGVTLDQLALLRTRADQIRRELGLEMPEVSSFSELVEYDVILVSEFFNPHHGPDGRFASAGGGGGRGRGAVRRSTPAERAAAKAKKVDEMVAKWGEKNRPAIEHMLSWMDEFTPAEADARRKRLSEAIQKQKDTQTLNSKVVDGEIVKGDYTAERLAAHDALIADYEDRVGWDNIPANREAILSGGLGGAGKGTMLHAMNIDEKNYVTIDPDALKGLMVKHGLVPSAKSFGLDDLDPPLRPLELAGLIHEESSDLSKRISSAAIRQGKNVILDNTMGSDSVYKKVAALKDSGYTVDGVFVDVSVDMSIQSALSRHMNGTVRGGDGGRFVDPSLQQASQPADSTYRSQNRERFNAIQKDLNTSVIIDNEAYAQRPVAYSDKQWTSLSDEGKRYVMTNILATDSEADLLAKARTL